jgi:hypothetical protein
MIDSFVLASVPKHSFVRVIRHINQTVDSGHDFEIIPVNVLRLLFCNTQRNGTVKHLTQSTLLATMLVADTFYVEFPWQATRVEVAFTVKLFEPICNRDPSVTLTVETPHCFQLRNAFDEAVLVKALDLGLQ